MASTDKPWTVPAQALLDEFHVDSAHGLTNQQVEQYRAKYGRNEIPSAEGTSLFVLILKQFEDVLVLILLGAAIISFILALTENPEDRLTAFVEPLVILIILILNATVGVVQETNAESAIEKLKESEASDAVVVRNGVHSTIPAEDLVPGDIIFITEGEKVPADARIIELRSNNVLMEEPALTGESEPTSKRVNPIKAENPSNGDKRNMVFNGSLCVKGKCLAIVTGTGLTTELGKIAGDLQKSDDDDDDDKTPLQRKLDEFGEQLSKVISVICILVWVINIGHFTDPVHGSTLKGAIYYFKIAVALAVAAIPEGLPAVVTTCLAIGAQKMAKNGAIVRSLPSVETLGCATVICSDKTGTLTTNMMTVQEIVVVSRVGDGSGAPAVTTTERRRGTGRKTANAASARDDGADLQTYRVFGSSWSPYGQVVDAHNEDSEIVYPSVDVPALNIIAKISTLCSESFLNVSLHPETQQPVFGKNGASTEAALLVLAEKLGTPEDDQSDVEETDDVTLSTVDIIRSKLPLEKQVSYVHDYWSNRTVQERILEFTRDRKSMSVVVYDRVQNQRQLLVKGAAEKVLERCHRINVDGEVIALTAGLRTQLMARVEQLNLQGLRSLGMAYKINPPAEDDPIYRDDDNFDRIEDDLIFTGFVGMLDPPRDAVPDALLQCQKAGIRVVVITGDHQLTAEAIGRRIGLFGQDEDITAHSFTGSQLNTMDDTTFDEIVKTAKIFSRVEHHHKLKIVTALRRHGEVVAMTGDGCNDATALSTADIGIAMGSGTSVAKEASKMVLQDDNFATIVMSVAQGRTIYNNTKQFIRYLISSNIGEVACIFLTAILGLPDALIPVQLLWVNLVTDGLPATALGVNPPDKDVMTQPPRPRDEPIIDAWLFIRYCVIGVYVGVATLAGYVWWYLYAQRGPQITYAALTSFGKCHLEPALFESAIDMVKSGQLEGSIAGTTLQSTCESLFANPIPSTVSLSILVLIEMFNAMNAISENQSIFVVFPTSNIYVIYATILSMLLHFAIIYIPFFADIFKVLPLNQEEWIFVVIISLPIFVIDEVLKFISRQRLAGKAAQQQRKTKVD